MKNRWRTLLPYGLILAADFYLLPLLIRDTGTAMLMLLCGLPLGAFGCGVLYGARHGFSLLLPLLAMLLFVPTLPIHYNATAYRTAAICASMDISTDEIRVGRAQSSVNHKTPLVSALT